MDKERITFATTAAGLLAFEKLLNKERSPDQSDPIHALQAVEVVDTHLSAKLSKLGLEMTKMALCGLVLLRPFHLIL